MRKSKPRPQPPAPRPSVRELILTATSDGQPPFLPVHNPEFEKCSQAIAKLRTFTDANRRPLALPSAVLPPL